MRGLCSNRLGRHIFHSVWDRGVEGELRRTFVLTIVLFVVAFVFVLTSQLNFFLYTRRGCDCIESLWNTCFKICQCEGVLSNATENDTSREVNNYGDCFRWFSILFLLLIYWLSFPCWCFRIKSLEEPFKRKLEEAGVSSNEPIYISFGALCFKFVGHLRYLFIPFIFLHRQNFWRIKFTPKNA